MNKKGFTLVELIAVVTILSIIMLISIPSINNSLGASKDSLDKITKKNLVDAGRILANEVIYCDMSDNARIIFNTGDCSDAKNKLIDSSVTISVDDLIKYKYFEDPESLCSGTIKISADNNYKVKVNVENVSCRK